MRIQEAVRTVRKLGYSATKDGKQWYISKPYRSPSSLTDIDGQIVAVANDPSSGNSTYWTIKELVNEEK